MQKQFNTAAPLQGTPKKKMWVKVLAVLAFLALVTSWLAGYMLGRNVAPKASGQIRDTILLTPENGDVQPLHLTGQIVYPDGTPYAGGRVQLHSEVRETVTDSAGRFAFFNVERERHKLSVTDKNGKVLAESIVDLNETAENTGVNIKKDKDGAYTADIAADVRLLEVVVELNSRFGVLDIHPDKLTYVSGSGKVVTPAGEASYRDSTVVTPAGTIITADGTIITPCSEGPLGIAVIMADERITYPDKKTTLTDGTMITGKGEVVLPGGSVITVNGGAVITTPDGKERTPGESGVTISGSNAVKPIGPAVDLDSGKKGTSGLKTDSNKGSGPTGTGSRDDKAAGSETGSDISDLPGKDTPNTPDIPDPPEVPDTPEIPEPDEELPHFQVSWTQGEKIDLFAGRTDGSADGEDIHPGSKGYYSFTLKNGNSFPVEFKLSVSEGSLHIPMRFCIVRGGGGKEILSGWWNTKKDAVSDSEMVRLPAGGTADYDLEWEWLYESGDDTADTLAGTDTEGIYTVELKIYAEQSAR